MRLRDQYRQLHEDSGVFEGYTVLGYAHEIYRSIRRHRSRTLLDYGCGKGRQYSEDHVERWWGIMPDLYDPAVPKFSTRPTRRYDGVICVDVLEHVPEVEVEALCRDLIRYAEQWVFATFCQRPANRILPNGENAHVTLKPRQWWKLKLKQARLEERKPHVKLIVRETP